MENKTNLNEEKKPSVIFLTMESDDLMKSIAKHKKNIEQDMRTILKDHTDLTIDELTKEEFKYIRLNIENMFTVEGKIKINYEIYEDLGLTVSFIPTALDYILFKSLYNDTDTFLIQDVISEIYEKYKKAKKHRYADTKENYLKEFLDMYVAKIQNILETLILCDEDTIEIKKIGDITQVKPIYTVESDRREIERDLISYELFKSIDQLNPNRYTTMQDLIKNKPFDIDYESLINDNNEKLLDDLNKTFDELYKDTEDYKHKDEIIKQLYEKTKLRK